MAGRVRPIDLARVKVVGRDGGEVLWYSHNLVTWGLGVDSTILAEKMRCLGQARYARPRGYVSDESRRRRGGDVDIPLKTGRGGAAAATWVFR